MTAGSDDEVCHQSVSFIPLPGTVARPVKVVGRTELVTCVTTTAIIVKHELCVVTLCAVNSRLRVILIMELHVIVLIRKCRTTRRSRRAS